MAQESPDTWGPGHGTLGASGQVSRPVSSGAKTHGQPGKGRLLPPDPTSSQTQEATPLTILLSSREPFRGPGT